MSAMLPPENINLETEASIIQQRITEVEAALQQANPEIKQYCAKIHAQLLACPELVYILPPESIGSYVQTLSKLAKLEIVAATTKRTASKALKNVSLDDL